MLNGVFVSYKRALVNINAWTKISESVVIEV